MRRMPSIPHPFVLVAAALAALAAGACAMLPGLLQGGTVLPPGITFREATLAHAPGQRELAAYYCPRLLREKVAFGAAADFTCAQFFGPSPRPEDVSIGFDVGFNVANPNQIPLPLSSILTAVTVFPQTNEQRLGAVCLRLCPPDDAACHGGADPAACEGAPGDIRGAQDLPRAVANMLIGQGIRAAVGQPPSFTAPRLLAGASLDVTTRFSFLPEVMIPLLQELARRSFDQLKTGQQITFAVPYKLEGTVFADAGSLGRVAAGFGPTTGQWILPAGRLLP